MCLSKTKNSIFAAEMKNIKQHQMNLDIQSDLRSRIYFPAVKLGRCRRFYEE